MKKYLGVTFLVASFFIATTAFAQSNMMMNSSGQATTITPQSGTSSTTISLALQDIYQAQNTTDQSKLNCSKITDAQFEKLGDAAMGIGITEQQHTAMENMMGGEGSATVKQSHINMGRSYLGCWSNYNSGPMAMMGGENNTFYWFGALTMVLAWALMILGILALVKWLKKNK